jgi:GNAT superfamily N-acetyltransferase
LSAFKGAHRVGGAAVAWKTPELDMLEGRDDLACLWDLRVHPDFRKEGIGHQLFTRALAWSRERSCRRLKIETQNINVPACRFYARQDCELGGINRYAYDESINEIQLLWYRNV